MSTSATIAIQTDFGVQGIRVNWDGGFWHTGPVLFHHYRSDELVKSLIDLGDISVIENTLNKCIAYGRDRGESDCQARTFPTWEELLECMGEEYNYLWSQGQWHVEFSGNVSSLDFELSRMSD